MGVRYAAALEQALELRDKLGPHLLLDAVGPQLADAATDGEVRLVDRVAESVAGVAADHQASLLGHEGAHVAHGAVDDDVDALHRDAAARGGVALDDDQPAVSGGACRLAGVALDPDGPRHDVLGEADAAVAAHADRRVLVHARAVVADVPLDQDLDRRVESGGDRVAAAGLDDAPMTRPASARQRVQPRVELADARGGEVDDLDGEIRGHAHATSSRVQEYTR